MNWGSLGTRELLTQESGLWTSQLWNSAEGSRAKTNSCYRIVSMGPAPEEGTGKGGNRSCLKQIITCSRNQQPNIPILEGGFD